MTNTKPTMETAAYEAIRLAQLHEHRGVMASSARLCAADAVGRFNAGDFESAHRRAVDSLRYSVGIFGEAFKAAQALA
jgi:hypothetical protein